MMEREATCTGMPATCRHAETTPRRQFLFFSPLKKDAIYIQQSTVNTWTGVGRSGEEGGGTRGVDGKMGTPSIPLCSSKAPCGGAGFPSPRLLLDRYLCVPCASEPIYPPSEAVSASRARMHAGREDRKWRGRY